MNSYNELLIENGKVLVEKGNVLIDKLKSDIQNIQINNLNNNKKNEKIKALYDEYHLEMQVIKNEQAILLEEAKRWINQKEEVRTANNNIDQITKPKDRIEKLIGENMSEDLLKEIISKLDKIIEELKDSRQSAEIDADRIVEQISQTGLDLERIIDR